MLSSCEMFFPGEMIAGPEQMNSLRSEMSCPLRCLGDTHSGQS